MITRSSNSINNENHFLNIPLIIESGFEKRLFMEILIFSSNGILVNKESTSRLATFRLFSYNKTSSTKERESLTVNSLWDISEKMGTKSFVDLYVRSPIVKRMGLIRGSSFLRSLCTLFDQ